MKIKRFEDLECWKEARILAKMIYSVIKHNGLSNDYRLKDQITGTGISVMNNIAEGFGSQVNKEFIRFLQFARRSALELQSCLYICLDQCYITDEEFKVIFVQSEKVMQIIDGMLRYLRKYKTPDYHNEY